MCQIKTQTKFTNVSVCAKSIKKKYKKLFLQKELKKLRSVLPGGESLSEDGVVEESISLIQALEEQLRMRMMAGQTPVRLMRHLPNRTEVNMDELRRAVMNYMDM